LNESERETTECGDLCVSLLKFFTERTSGPNSQENQKRITKPNNQLERDEEQEQKRRYNLILPWVAAPANQGISNLPTQQKTKEQLQNY
jgi:hypothetical protein